MTLGFLQQSTRRFNLRRWFSIKRVRLLPAIGLLGILLFLLSEVAWRLLAAPTLVATKSATLLLDQNHNGLADPGDHLRYTVSITNRGDTDAPDLHFNDTIAADTNLIASSLRTTPLAHNDDGYNTVGNVLLSVPVGQGLLRNDRDLDGTGGLSVATYGATSARGGGVTVAPDGSFTYNPPPGYSGLDTFSYGLADGEDNHITATVTITVGQVVWFINNSSSAPGDGRWTSPFPSISAFMTGAADEAGDLIFVYQGTAAYSGALTLLNQQQVIGHGSGLTLAPNLTIAAAGRPTIANVVLATGNSVRGLNINAGAAIGLNGTNVGALIVNSVAVTSSNTSAVYLSGGSSAMTVTLDSVNANGGVHGIDLTNNLGRVTINGGTIQNTSGHAINLANNTGPLDFTLRNSTISNAAVGHNGLHLEIPGNGSFGLVTVQNNTIRNNGSTGVRASVGGMGSIGKIMISNNTFTNNRNGIDLATNDRGGIIFDIRDNATMNGDQTQINIAATDPLHNDGVGPTMTGIIRNNKITVNPATYAIAAWIVTNGDGNITVDVASNQISGFGESGIAVEALGGTGRVHASLAGNTVSTTASTPIAALYLRSGDGSSGESNLLCVNLSSNKMTAGASAVADYYLERTSAATPFQIQSLSPSSATAVQAASFVTGTDAAPPATAVVTPGTYVRATCETVNLTARPLVAPLLARAPVKGWLPILSRPAAVEGTSWLPRLSFPTLHTSWRRLFRTAVAHAGGETVALAIDTLHAGQSLAITFDVTIDPAFVGTEVCNQGLVSGGVGNPLATDDPAVAGSAEPTWFAVVPPDTTPPETTLTNTPPNPSKSPTARFEFSGSDNATLAAEITFECKLDNRSFAPCTTPLDYSDLLDGLHTFQVRAIDRLGNVDPTPETFTWNINLVVVSPDLTASKHNDGGGSALLDQPWRWQITLNNFGNGAATFADGQTLLIDNLPAALLTYGAPSLVAVTDVSGADQIRCTITNHDLICRAEGAPVTIAALTGAVTVQFSAQTTVAGDYGNPRPNGRCQVDPDDQVDEPNEENNGCSDLIKVGLPDLTITKQHLGDFITGQQGAQYLITVYNVGAVRSAGAVQVDEELPVGLTVTAITGAGWLCTITPLRCTRSDAVAASAAYPPIILTVDVAEDGAADLLNRVTVTGGNDRTPANNSATDLVQLRVLSYNLFLPVAQRE